VRGAPSGATEGLILLAEASHQMVTAVQTRKVHLVPVQSRRATTMSVLGELHAAAAKLSPNE
jgi:hypothetical protein